MRGMRRLVGGVLVATVLAGCGGSMATGPASGPPGNGGNGGGGGGGGGGGVSGGVGGGPAPNSVTVTVGNNYFRSDRNASANPAVDTVAAGGKVTWTWVSTGNVPHTVESVGTPSFTSGPIEMADGSTYEISFVAPGSYRYDCAIHGNMMTGIVVVR